MRLSFSDYPTITEKQQKPLAMSNFHRIFLFVLVLSLAACSAKQTIETEQISYGRSYCLTDACNDSITLQFEIEFPTVLAVDTALTNIQKDLITRLFGPEYSSLSLENAIEKYVSLSYNEYIANNRAFAERLDDDEDREGDILSEQQSMRGRVVATDNNILTYEVEQYVYMGGAHGINTRYFYNYDMQTGNLIKETDVFKDGYNESLTRIMRQTLIDQSETFSSMQDFIDAGYEFDSIRPNGNFAFTEDAVIYLFNPYEIAPYVYGETEIVMDKSLIKDLLR